MALPGSWGYAPGSAVGIRGAVLKGTGGLLMASSEMGQAVGPELTSERIAGGVLPRVLNSFDMVAIFVAIVLFISNVPGFYGNGPVSITFLLIGFVTFLVPGAIVTGQLGFLFPGEGSIYLWTYKALGPFASFFAGFVAWWPGVLVLVGSGTVVSQLLQYIGGWTFPAWLQGVVILLVIGVAASVASLRFRLTQNLVNVVFLLYGLAILLIGLSGVLWLVQGHASFTNFGIFNAGPGGWFQGMNTNPLDFTSATS